MSPVDAVCLSRAAMRPENKLYLFQITPGQMVQIGTFYWKYPNTYKDKHAEEVGEQIEQRLARSIINVTLGKHGQAGRERGRRHEFSVAGRNWPRYGWEWATY